VTIGCSVSVMFFSKQQQNGCYWAFAMVVLCFTCLLFAVFHSPYLSPMPLFLAHAGIGGDAFCLYFDAKTKKVTAMLGNGGAPGALTLQVTQ